VISGFWENRPAPRAALAMPAFLKIVYTSSHGRLALP
jgi:hypothetical protein